MRVEAISTFRIAFPLTDIGAVKQARSCSKFLSDTFSNYLILKEMAEGIGFEPTIGFDPYNGLANRRLQPLGHPSTEEWIRHGACADSSTGLAFISQTSATDSPRACLKKTGLFRKF
jgi:hypothetical protein